MRTRRLHLVASAYIGGLIALAIAGYGVENYAIHVQQKAKLAKSHFATDISYIDLPRMNMTLASGTDDHRGRLRMDISLEVDKNNLDRIDGFQPIITDRIVSFTHKLNLDDIRLPESVPWLRHEILREASAAAYPLPIMDVVFRNIVME